MTYSPRRHESGRRGLLDDSCYCIGHFSSFKDVLPRRPLFQAQQQAAQDLAKKADNDPTVLGKLVKWGQSLSDTAAKTTVSEAAKEVFKIALRLSGLPIP